MTFPISTLANMEFMLYGGTLGANANCPSYVNGYKAGSNYWYGNGYNLYNPSFAGAKNGYGGNSTYPYSSSIFSNGSGETSNSAENTSFGASQSDLKVLKKYYLEGKNPSESLASAAVGGGAFAVLSNPRLVAHPWNSLTSLGNAEKVFADVKKEGSALNKLWKSPETHKVMTDAYSKMHRLEAGARWKFGLYKKRIDETTYNTLKSEMEAALKSGDKLEIAKATEKIRIQTSAKTGEVSNVFKKMWSKITGNTGSQTLAEKLADNKAITEAAQKNLAEKGSKTLLGNLKHGFKSQGVLGGLFFAAMEFAFDGSDIMSAFSKDTSTGMKQLGQTTVKAAGSIIGWTAGEAVGAWAGAKLGAAVGTAICPGLGTAIGAVAGLVGGSIGCALMGKLTHKIVGDNVGAKAEADKLAQTQEGQSTLLTLTAQQAQSDEKLTPEVALAIKNVASVYGVA